MKKTILTYIILLIFMINLVNLSAFEFDNVKQKLTIEKGQALTIGEKELSYNKLWKKYEPVEIKNNFGLGSTLFKGAITEHTDFCLNNCNSNMIVEIKERSQLIQDISFYKLKYNQWISGNILIETNVDYSLYYKDEVKWTKFNIRDIFDAGTYEIKIEGYKSPYEKIDWVIKTQGETLDEWAVWDTFTIGLTEENLTFTGTESIIRNLSIPDETFLINASITLTGYQDGSGNYPNNAILYINDTHVWNGSSSLWTEDILAYYDFDGDVTDSTVNGYDGTDIGTTNNNSGILNQARQFDGTSDMVNVTYSDLQFTNQNFSVNLWVNPLNNGLTFTTLVGGNSGAMSFYFYSNDNYRLAFGKAGGAEVRANYSNLTGFNTGWYMTTVVYDQSNNKVYFYLNGTADAGNPYPYSTEFTQNQTLIGGTGSSFAEGTFDEIGFWNRTLTDDEVTELWNSGSASEFGGLGRFRETQKTDLTTILNNYISICTAVSGNCTIPFNFSSINGKLGYSSLLFTNDGFIENSQSFNNETIEGNNEEFKINISLDFSGFSTVIYLNYDGTNYFASTSDTGNIREYSRSIRIPSVTGTTNKTFYWNVGLTDSTGTYYFNSTFNNQTVKNLDFDNCSAYSQVLYNFTVLDEELQINLENTSLDVSINVYDSSGENLITNFSTSSGDNPSTFCLNQNLTEDINYLLDATIKYEADDFATEYYNIQNFNLTNSTLNQKINLYDLNSSDATSFKIKFTGVDSLPLENALIYIDRQYLGENVFKTVEIPKTDSNGETIGNFVRNDIVYNLRVTKNGVLLATFENIRAFCSDFTIGNCEINLDALASADELFTYNNVLGIIFETNPTYNSTTDTISFSFTSSNGDPKTINMQVERNDIFGNRSICNSTLFSASGTLSCSIGDLTDTTLITKVYIDNYLISTTSINISDKAPYGDIGYVAWFILTLILVLVSNDKTWILVGMSLSYIGAVILGLVEGTIIGLGSAGVWLLSITIIGVWKLNKENPQ